MEETIVLRADDPIIKKLPFKPYRSIVQRRVKPFVPSDNEPQTKEVITPWGATLIAKKGDMLISEMDKPEDAWPIDADIFDQTYLVVSPGFCVKRAVTLLVPMVEVTGGDPDRTVTVQSLEGEETVRAGDFFLAKGVKGEIWAYPKDKAAETMRPAE
ncbi:MAG: hypothetical protein Fur002_25220 [Anaerolineales bacterium]